MSENKQPPQTPMLTRLGHQRLPRSRWLTCWVIFSIIVLLIVACVTYFFVYKSVRKNHPIEFHKELYWGEIIVKTESHQGEIIGKTAGVTCGVAILLFLIGWVIHQYKLAERRRLLRTHCCLNCGYDLTGNVSGVCPECGEKA